MSSSTDVEYEYGRRVEQVVSSPGNIEQMSVGVVVRGRLSADKQARIAQLVRMAAGLNERRGDAVTVQPLEATETRAAPSEPAAAAIGTEPIVPPATSHAAAAPALGVWIGAAGVTASVLVILLAMRRRTSAVARQLTAAERAALLSELQQTFAAPTAAAQYRSVRHDSRRQSLDTYRSTAPVRSPVAARSGICRRRGRI